MTSDKDFINTLRRLIIKKQMAALAAFRSGNSFSMIPYLNEHLTEIDDDVVFESRVLVAYLLGLQSPADWFNTGNVNFGASIKQLKQKLSPPNNPASDAHGIEKRFMALLDAEGDYRKQQFEYFAKMLSQHNVRVDWLQLLTDLQTWDADEKTVQRAWSTSFWSTAVGKSEAARSLGVITSAAKKKSSAENGKKGGRPKKKE